MANRLRHLRSNTTENRPDAIEMVEGQIAVNYAATSPALFFKDTSDGVVKVGPTHVGPYAPNSTPGGSSGNSLGESWLDTSVDPAALKVWDGAKWVLTSPSEVAAGPMGPEGPAGPQGEMGPQGPASTIPGPQGPAGADSTVPGPQGESGTGIRYKGEVATVAELPTTGNAQGDLWVIGNRADDTSPAESYIWNEETTKWDYGGKIQGPAGATGPQGEQGLAGYPGADSTIPGPAGPQGEQGEQGLAGYPGADSTVPGPAGPQGPAGEQGLAGYPGADSTVPGPAGPAGPQGEPGGSGSILVSDPIKSDGGVIGLKYSEGLRVDSGELKILAGSGLGFDGNTLIARPDSSTTEVVSFTPLTYEDTSAGTINEENGFNGPENRECYNTVWDVNLPEKANMAVVIWRIRAKVYMYNDDPNNYQPGQGIWVDNAGARINVSGRDARWTTAGSVVISLCTVPKHPHSTFCVRTEQLEFSQGGGQIRFNCQGGINNGGMGKVRFEMGAWCQTIFPYQK